jgi:hypothetical protein
MTEVINLSPAKVCGVLPGKSGMVDAENPSAKAALKSGALVDAKAHRAALLASVGGDSALSAALDEVAALKAKVSELEAALAKATEKPARGGAKAGG